MLTSACARPQSINPSRIGRQTQNNSSHKSFILNCSDARGAPRSTVSCALQRARQELGEEFDRTYSLCVREVFSSLLGETACSIVLQYIENRLSVSIDEVAKHRNDLSTSLQEMFGSGAGVIEAEILKALRRRIDRSRKRRKNSCGHKDATRTMQPIDRPQELCSKKSSSW